MKNTKYILLLLIYCTNNEHIFMDPRLEITLAEVIHVSLFVKKTKFFLVRAIFLFSLKNKVKIFCHIAENHLT